MSADLARALAEKEAVLRRLREYFGVMQRDKRMKVMGEILMRELARIEEEEREKAGRPE